jgi:hypothetical protein
MNALGARAQARLSGARGPSPHLVPRDSQAMVIYVVT